MVLVVSGKGWLIHKEDVNENSIGSAAVQRCPGSMGQHCPAWSWATWDYKFCFLHVRRTIFPWHSGKEVTECGASTLWKVCGEVDAECLGQTARGTRLSIHGQVHKAGYTSEWSSSLVAAVQTSSHWLHLQEPC